MREDVKITVIKMNMSVDSLRFVEDTINKKFNISASTFFRRGVDVITDGDNKMKKFVKVQGIGLTVFIENLDIVGIKSGRVVKFEEKIVDSVTETEKGGFISIIVTDFVR